METIATFDTITTEDLARASGGFGTQLTAAMNRATQLGLHITATTDRALMERGPGV